MDLILVGFLIEAGLVTIVLGRMQRVARQQVLRVRSGRQTALVVAIAIVGQLFLLAGIALSQ